MFYKNYNILPVVIIFSIFLFSCYKPERVIVEKNLPTYDQKVEEFVVTRLYKGKVNMIVEGKSAIIDAKNIAYLDNPLIRFYDEGKYVSNLIAESIMVNMETYDVKCSGECVMNTINSENLQTTNLMYDAKNNLIYSDNDVKFIKPGETVYGTGFKSDIKLNDIVIKNQKVLID
ncbi:MAG: LPS export ABC transporter periplasmic protein LptC [Endomicrobium sp.]|jgi:LPS export ABC transporter protein LptC|nr:LPS export ABC transporter periplasmic protein LptC [Endomicrobium sp.]